MSLKPMNKMCRLALMSGLGLLAGCAANPVYPPQWADADLTPRQVAAAPETAGTARVIWGGRIIDVTNKAAQTEVEILAYPLDDDQRPLANDVGNGRFIAVIPGYVEPLDYPSGGWVTLQGTIQGVRSDRVGKAPYVFPLVKVRAAHVWSRQDMQRRSNVHVSLGVGIGVH